MNKSNYGLGARPTELVGPPDLRNEILLSAQRCEHCTYYRKMEYRYTTPTEGGPYFGADIYCAFYGGHHTLRHLCPDYLREPGADDE